MSRRCRRWIRVALFAWAASAVGVDAIAYDAEWLRLRHGALREQLANNQFNRPLYLNSSEQEREVSGDIYADLDWSFGVVGPALQNAHHWCEILMLPINIKGCRVSPGHDPELAHDSGLAVSVGRKHSRSLEDAFTLEFDFAVVASQRDYRRITLTAADGPLNTSNYRIMVEVADLDGEHTFMHLRYSYESGLAARVAMRGYLATAGRNKIGFSVVGRKENGDPVFTRGLRGVIERNTMRYYLAIEAYLASLAAHPSQRIDKRLNDWFFSCERYSAQLHELDHHEYVTMKRRELERQRE